MSSPVVSLVTRSAAAANPPLNADAIASRVQAFYDQTKTFQADFKQEYYIRLHDQRRTSEGRVAFEKPGKMSWKYDQPNGNRVVSDGRTLKVYERSDQQMFEQPVDKSQYPAALAFLMGQGELTRSFSLRLLDPTTVKFEGGWVLEGTPKEPTPAYQKVLLYVDAATSQVRRVLIIDAQGNRNRFDFNNPLVNTPVPAGEFNFTAPEGTQIVRP
jgi:outer membrane lipoprotein carrier protein